MEKKVLIVEDEPLIADDLSFHLQDLGVSEIKISLKYEDALKKLTEHQFDLVLLDVNLSGEKDGIDVARFINRTNPTPFIFITSYYDADTLNRAKEVAPVAYILKPFNQQDIQVNVEMAFHKILSSRQTKPEKFFIKDKEGLVSIDPDEIDYVEAFDNYAKIYSAGQAYIISHTLKSIEDKLLNFGFERVHKSYLVNFAKITMISEGYIFFGKMKVPIGRAFKTDFMAKISML
ncbi:response regulator [Imperialibacter roseus]|uniref:Response regulator n=1 Tax=Imperialibacter roseus TaxID=1324217 RepID=A0ABZ0IR68_9BACT|nr:response regulator [Imperialibacter roseus]WOK06923.1 response regulator [Imperialibacter roseus]